MVVSMDSVKEVPGLQSVARNTGTPASISQVRGTVVDKLRRRLAGDLDTMVLKAMHKEPERRYASAAELREDLERHLAGLPVRARSDTWGYRARTFIRRHRVGVGAADHRDL